MVVTMLALAAGAQAQGDPIEDLARAADEAIEPVDRALQEPCDATADLDQCHTATAAPKDPGQTCHDAAQLALGCDTQFTPVPKDGQELGWTQVGGVIFPGARAEKYREEDSPTPVTVDFYAVEFENSERGFAAGARCRDDPPPGSEGDALDEHLEECERVPVIYRFRSEDFPQWQEVYRGSSPGFIGGITIFPGTDRALAVGGDGCYPRREWPWSCPGETDPPAASAAADPLAGKGRAWYLPGESADWHETGVPTEMTGMNTVDASPRPTDCKASSACAFAGGFRQIWTWRDDKFLTPPLTPDAPDGWRSTGAAVTEAQRKEWRYRVRQIRFDPGTAASASAVTAGCCDTGSAQGQRDLSKESPVRFTFDNTGWGRPAGSLIPRWPSASLYAAVTSTLGGYTSYVVTPGGPPTAHEPGSQIEGFVNGAPSRQDPSRFILSRSLRLVAADGDLQGFQRLPDASPTPNPGADQPDGVLDWAVGGISTSQQAVAYTTTTQTATVDWPNPLDCPAEFWDESNPNSALDCQPDAEVAEQTRSKGVFTLPSYFLNGFTMVGSSGVAWAVGDRGALMRLGGEGSSGRVPPESRPSLGSKSEAKLGDAAPYSAERAALTSEPGLVPARATRPSEQDPRLTAYGSPNPSAPPQGANFGPARDSTGPVAMSRDGSEGWAVGPTGSAGAVMMALHRFDGARWTRCDMRGVPGAIPPDPACAALRPLAELRNGRGIAIEAIARIPFEFDLDPTNDDEFEAVALTESIPAGSPGLPNRPLLLRYRKGEWTIALEESVQAEFDPGVNEIAFSSHDEGWAVGGSGVGGGAIVYRYQRGEWTRCVDANVEAACEAPAGLMPLLDADNVGARITTAGARVYLYGTRLTRTDSGNSTVDTFAGQAVRNTANYPFILYKDPGKPWRAAFNPKQDDPENRDLQGRLVSLSAAFGPDRSYSGWAIGNFGQPTARVPIHGSDVAHGTGQTPALHATGTDGTEWEPMPADQVARDYLLKATVRDRDLGSSGGNQRTMRVVALPGMKGQGGAIAVPQVGGPAAGPTVWFDPEERRWEVFPTPFPSVKGGNPNTSPEITGLASDNTGGAWLAITDSTTEGGTYYYRYSQAAPRAVFSDAPHPIREEITGVAAGGDGRLWATTNSAAVYRYDRLTGWDRVQIPGWEPGRVVTRGSEAFAVAAGPDGRGVVVGKDGRIANVGPSAVSLDAAAGASCTQTDPPCGAGRDLRSAAIAPDGATLVGGEAATVLWRPADGAFRSVTSPSTAPFATITGISYPSPEMAWLVTNTGEIYRGDLVGSDWSWTREDRDARGNSITRGMQGTTQALTGVALDASGHGYAVGEQGVIVEREDGAWRRLSNGYLDNLRSITLGPDGRGALVGGDNGLILTLDAGSFEVARPADWFDPLTTGHYALASRTARIVSVALIPGDASGDVEAWAVSQIPGPVEHRNPRPSALLHYSSDRSDPLLDGGREGAGPLRDAPDPAPGSVSFSAFGRSDCQYTAGATTPCPELTGSNEANDVVARAVRDEVVAESTAADFALFTGDVGDIAGRRNADVLDTPVDRVGSTRLDPSQIHERWSELIVRELAEAGVPLYGAIGARDLAPTGVCNWNGGMCANSNDARAGTNLAWRSAMEKMPAPWGNEEPASTGELAFEPVESGTPSVNADDAVSVDPDGDGPLPHASAPRGASTHYAFDVERGGEKLLRVVVVDTSLRSLAASDAMQAPVQEQLAWLRDVLASTPAGTRKVVVSNTPTYSYGPGSGTETQSDGTLFESVLMAEGVDLVVSGRMGWNGLYWALAPGLHYPCPGSEYPAGEPRAASVCGSGGGSELEDLAEGLQKQAGTVVGEGRGGALPFVVASNAGGKFGPTGEDDGSAEEGYWRGYTQVTMEPGESGRIIVEQRPIFEWIGLTGSKHVMRPRSKLRLNGFGREPAGIDVPLRYFQIDSPAVTHRYDLLRAKPDQPWLALTDSEAAAQADGPDECGAYVCLGQDVGSIDSQTGVVQAGAGKHSGAYAIAMLSIGDDAATKPLYFETSPSFRAAASPTPKPVPKGAASPPAPTVETPHIPEFNSPTFDAPPVPPPLAIVPPAALAASEAAPPSPPVPPPVVPANPAPSPLDLSFAPTGLTIAPAASVIPPPAPPINPAPPGGARKEARQRQAAAQKGGADSGASEGAQETQALGGDPANGPDSADQPMTRHESSRPARQDHSFTRLDRASEASPLPAWGAGLTIAALTLALGFTTLGPRSRRREPELPAPAWSAARRQRRY